MNNMWKKFSLMDMNLKSLNPMNLCPFAVSSPLRVL
jgi:hypothetical protein